MTRYAPFERKLQPVSSSSVKSGSAPGPTGHPVASGMKALQRMSGNRAVQRMISGLPAQRMSLDEEELQMKAAPVTQRMELDEDELQLKAVPAAQRMSLDEEELQMKAVSAAQRMSQDDEELQLKSAPAVQRKGGDGMPDLVRAKMEQAFSADFSDVKVHVGDKAGQVGALAYAQGSDIHFAPGQYNPESSKGQQLLGHELAHIVQQKQGRVKPTAEINGVAVNDDPSLEREADEWGPERRR
ncbi:DUF4157 domain-containing protein [Paenibacillus sp. P26]|nr:DUF4157 domain-containing protein [Paenibacillus sp. P26]